MGFLVKRPDVALMFHRGDVFVPLDGFTWQDGSIVLRADDDATGRAAARRLGIDVDACVVWSGLPVMTAAGAKLGYVGAVVIESDSGLVESVIVSEGVASSAMLGTTRIPVSMVQGFRTGIGEPLLAYGELDEDDLERIDPSMLGALLVTEEALQVEAKGGVAEKAGQVTAVAADKASQATALAAEKAHSAAEAAKPVMDSAAKAAGEAIHKGAFATGRQIARSKGMFSAFKEEFNKAAKGDDARE